jgi:site-specific recombinase XerD
MFVVRTSAQSRQEPLGLFRENPVPPLYDRMVEVLRVPHYSRRTGEAYRQWIHRFIAFQGHRHAQQLAEHDVHRFLTRLAVKQHVSASLQNRALSAILLHQHVFVEPFDAIDGVVCTRPPSRALVLPTVDNVSRMRAQLRGEESLIVMLCDGGGPRLRDVLRRHVMPFDRERGELTVRERKGHKACRALLPQAVIRPLQEHLQRVRVIYPQNLPHGCGRAQWPLALARTYVHANRELNNTHHDANRGLTNGWLT